MRRKYCSRPGCGRLNFSRDNCQHHLREDNARIARGEVTDDQLVADGKRAPRKRPGRKRMKRIRKAS